MAEDEVTEEQLAAIAAENEEQEQVNYKAPAVKSVKEIQDLDKDDESLRKYKEALLGSGPTEAGNAACVRVLYFVNSQKPPPTS
uniref:Rho GDP-dissociation inhibitor 1 n=1 Tax=Labrus bergylta TaxID=56723 RepID=A0A3Q3EI89_9LABR